LPDAAGNGIIFTKGDVLMREIRNVYIIGLGAIGGMYGSRIMENCPETLKVLVGGSRFESYTKNGVVVNGKKIPFTYVRPGYTEEKADLIMIAVKYHHLDQTLKDISSLVGPNTIILSLLNGITSEEIIGGVFGMDKMLHSFCVATDAVREGTGITYANIGRIVFGDRDNSGTSEKVTAVKDYFDRAKLPYSVPENIMRELWWKFMLNVGINQVSAILRAPYGRFARKGYAQDLMADASREVIKIAQKAGICLSEDDIQKIIEIISTLSPEGKTSMLQDVEAGRKTEVEIFSGAVCDLGRKYGVPTPVNDLLFRIIRAIEEP
jgi:2-dehydropantoate 2-reductase